MKTLLMTSLLIFVFPYLSICQNFAGIVPNGMVVEDPNISLSNITPYTADTAYLDLDCDSINDLFFLLAKGSSNIDSPNSLDLVVLDTSISVCMKDYMSSLNNSVVLYEYGDLLDCTKTDTIWESCTSCLISYYGTLGAYTPGTVNEKYIAYQKNNQHGWIKISYDLNDFSAPTLYPITLDVSEVAVGCPVVSNIESLPKEEIFTIYPNPSGTGIFRIKNDNYTHEFIVKVYNSLGEIIQPISGNLLEIDLSDHPSGVYFFEFSNKEKRIEIRKVIK